MLQEIMIVFLVMLFNGIVDASEICLSRDETVTCRQPPPEFNVPRPSWYPDPPCPAKPLIITGCAISIICIVVVFVLLPFVKNKCQPALVIFINLCVAHLGLYVSLLVSVIIDGNDIIGLFVDFFLLASSCSYLVEAIAILFSVVKQNKDIKWSLLIILTACCWIVPALKCIITIVIDQEAYYYKLPDYFLANGRTVAIVDICLIAIIFIATVVVIILAICLLHRSSVSDEEKEADRKKILLQIGLCLLMFIPFYTWVFTLLGIGLISDQAFGILFIIFGPAKGIAILITFVLRFLKNKENLPRKSSCVSPENDEENADSIDKKSSAL